MLGIDFAKGLIYAALVVHPRPALLGAAADGGVAGGGQPDDVAHPAEADAVPAGRRSPCSRSSSCSAWSSTTSCRRSCASPSSTTSRSASTRATSRSAARRRRRAPRAREIAKADGGGGAAGDRPSSVRGAQDGKNGLAVGARRPGADEAHDARQEPSDLGRHSRPPTGPAGAVRHRRNATAEGTRPASCPPSRSSRRAREHRQLESTMEWVETVAKTLAEAREMALDRLGVGEDDAEFEMLEEPKPGCSAGSAARPGCGPGCGRPRFARSRTVVHAGATNAATARTRAGCGRRRRRRRCRTAMPPREASSGGSALPLARHGQAQSIQAAEGADRHGER